MPEGKRVAFLALGILLAVPAMFFSYYTARLLYIDIAAPGIVVRRQTGMYIGAVAFPLAAFFLGWLSCRCFRKV